MIGGIGEKRTLPLVAKYASMWNIPTLSPDRIREKIRVLERLCRDIQRDCNEIEISVLTPVSIHTDPAEVQPLLERLAELRNLPSNSSAKQYWPERRRRFGIRSRPISMWA